MCLDWGQHPIKRNTLGSERQHIVSLIFRSWIGGPIEAENKIVTIKAWAGGRKGGEGTVATEAKDAVTGRGNLELLQYCRVAVEHSSAISE